MRVAVAHVGSTLGVGFVAVALACFVRRRPDGARGRIVRVVLIGLAVGLASLELLVAWHQGWLTWSVVVPLQLCDAAVVLAVLALTTLRQSLAEILYFWALSGSTLALLTPDLGVDAPLWEQAVFVGLHGVVVVAALVLVFGLGRRPRPGGHWRAFGATNALVLVASVVNRVAGTNYLYLCAKPYNPTLLDYLGPWPVYILVGEAMALLMFWFFALPFRRPQRESA